MNLIEMLEDYRRKSDVAWQQDGQIAASEAPSRKKLDYVRDLFKQADAAYAVLKAALTAQSTGGGDGR